MAAAAAENTGSASRCCCSWRGFAANIAGERCTTFLDHRLRAAAARLGKSGWRSSSRGPDDSQRRGLRFGGDELIKGALCQTNAARSARGAASSSTLGVVADQGGFTIWLGARPASPATIASDRRRASCSGDVSRPRCGTCVVAAPGIGRRAIFGREGRIVVRSPTLRSRSGFGHIRRPRHGTGARLAADMRQDLARPSLS